MKKFVNHVDHVTWIARYETIAAHVAEMEKILEVELARFERPDMGFVMYLSWEAGLEVVAAMPERTEFNEALHAHLDARGEGLLGIVFGVRDLERHKARLEAMGHFVGPLMDDLPTSPWHHKLVLRERIGPPLLNSWLVLGDIDYQDGVVAFENA